MRLLLGLLLLRHSWRGHAGHARRHARPGRTDNVAHLLLLLKLLLLSRIEFVPHNPRSSHRHLWPRWAQQAARILSREGDFIRVLDTQRASCRLIIGRRGLLLLLLLARTSQRILTNRSHAVGHHTGLLLLLLSGTTTQRNAIWTLL